MAHLRVFNQTKQILLCSLCKVASSDHERMRGLLDRTSMQAGEGLLLTKCNSVHTVGMKFPIDIVYIDWAGKVKMRSRNAQPGGLGGSVPGTDCVLELPSGGALSTEVGDQITFTRL